MKSWQVLAIRSRGQVSKEARQLINVLQMVAFFCCSLCSFWVGMAAGPLEETQWPELGRKAQNPDTVFRPVPLWWWDGERLNVEKLRWQLDQLHEQGVDQACVIYRAPLRGQPVYFTEEWWEIYRQVVDHAAAIGVKLWLTDGIAWGSPFINNSVLDVNPDYRGQLLKSYGRTVKGPGSVRHELPQGYEVSEILGAYAYRKTADGIEVEVRHDLTSLLKDRKLEWKAPPGDWQIFIFYRQPMGFQGDVGAGFGRGFGIDFTNPEAMQTLIGMTAGAYEKRVGPKFRDTIVGTFQDELVTHHLYGFPPYSKRLEAEFSKRMGYDLRPCLGALFADAGRLTDKIRTDYFEVLVQLYEEAFYKPYFQWHEQRGMMVSHDQFGRLDLIAQTWGYGDYFRTQSWYQAPGYDDWNQAVPGRNWRDAKLAASIAQLYGRSRVWVEALHSSGWGLDLQEQVQVVNENFVYGANVYDMHGFDYTTLGGWYNWAPPSAHYRMPYWAHYRQFSDYVTRLSYLQSQGDHLVDVGVFYPVHSIQANYAAQSGPTKLAGLIESYFWDIGAELLKHQIDFHFINDQSIQKATTANGKLSVSGVDFSTIILPPLTTIDERTLSKLEEFVDHGGLLISYVRLPNASTQAGRGDPKVAAILHRLFGSNRPEASREGEQPNGGATVFRARGVSDLHQVIASRRPLDVKTDAKDLLHQHRRAGDWDLFFLYNRSAESTRTTVAFRGLSRSIIKFDSRTGKATPLFVRYAKDGYTCVQLDFAPFEAYHVFIGPSPETDSLKASSLDEVVQVSREGTGRRVEGWHRSTSRVEIEDGPGNGLQQNVAVAEPITLSPDGWEFQLRPTMDNRWGDFRLPASPDFIGAEVRQVRYQLESEGTDGLKLGWGSREFDDTDWKSYTYSVGPYWWVLGPVPNQGSEAVTLTEFGPETAFDVSRAYPILGGNYRWQAYAFSQQFGLEKDPDYWMTLGAQGSVNPSYLELGQVDHFGLFYLATQVHSPRDTHAVLLAPTAAYWGSHRIWVNGEVVSDPFHRDNYGRFPGLIGIDLKQGWNSILIKTNLRHRSVSLSVTLWEQEEILRGDQPPRAPGPPRLAEFENSPFILDLYGDGKERVGWYRFTVPPGTRRLKIEVAGEARFFVNGREESWDSGSGELRLSSPLPQGGIVAVRLVHEPGKYAGAAISKPIQIETGVGRIQLGDWSKQGLLSYSGMAVYRKTFHLPEAYKEKKLVLDLGRVDASASVVVNQKPAGICGWAPYRFDITDLVKAGENVLEVTVANSLANHYIVGTPDPHVYERQTESGLFGPVRILPYTPVDLVVPGS